MHDGWAKSGAGSAFGAERGEEADARDTLEAAFREYCREIVGMLRKRVKDAELAADLAQTAFTRLAARQGAPEAFDQPRAHLMQIARNAAVDHARREAVEKRYEYESATVFGTTEAETRTPEEIALQREQLAQLEEIIRDLPAMRRRIFILSRIHQLSLDEIADQEGMTKRAVLGHIERALADIRAGMGDTRPRRSPQRGDG